MYIVVFYQKYLLASVNRSLLAQIWSVLYFSSQCVQIFPRTNVYGQQCLKFCNREKLAYKYLRLLILESNHHNHNHHHHHHHHHHCVEVSVSCTVKHAKMESCHLCKTPQMMMMIMMIIIIIIVIIIIIIVIIMVSGECELYREACEDGVLPGETILAYHGVCREKPCSKSKYFDLLNQIK